MLHSHNMSLFTTPRFIDPPRLVIGFSGWMDGGDVATGTIDYLLSEYKMERLGVIYPESFYFYHLPGTLESSASLRPYVVIENGLVRDFEEPQNVLYYSQEQGLIILMGKEPHYNWGQYSDCIFELAQEYSVHTVYCVGSYAGLAPHTREPRISTVISCPSLRDQMSRCNVKFANYEGPSSIITYLIRQAPSEGVTVSSLVAEIPPYIQGRYPRCIEAVLRRLSRLLDLDLDLADLRLVSDEVEKRLNKVIRERSELTEHIIRLEENYDKDIFESEMPDLKQWLIDQGIRLD